MYDPGSPIPQNPGQLETLTPPRAERRTIGVDSPADFDRIVLICCQPNFIRCSTNPTVAPTDNTSVGTEGFRERRMKLVAKAKTAKIKAAKSHQRDALTDCAFHAARRETPKKPRSMAKLTGRASSTK